MKPKPVRIRSEAQAEIEEALERYREETRELADRLLLVEISMSIDLICLHPKLYPMSTRNTRRRILHTFPYSIIYQEKQDVVLIVAFAHAKRRPGYWSKRLKQ
jgi:plasmid stabilization system protein ParE